MNWRERIISDWPNEPQKIARAKVALAALDQALGELAGLGHPLHIEEGYVPPPPPGWPKAVFHVLAGARVVRSQHELDELGGDWYGTMEEARQAEGMRMQMRRGGIFNPRQMPTLLTQTPQEIMANQMAAVKAREDQRRLVDDMRLQHRSGFAEQRIIIDYKKETEHEPDLGEAIERLRLRT
jgi:hypothetical protein